MLKDRRTDVLKYENFKTLKVCLGYNYMYVPALVFIRFCLMPDKALNVSCSAGLFLRFGYIVKKAINA